VSGLSLIGETVSLWLLVVTVHFLLLDRGMTLDLPSETIFQSHERCQIAGKYITDSLTQDGTHAEWKCVEIGH
jgi:hypothetical protein